MAGGVPDEPGDLPLYSTGYFQADVGAPVPWISFSLDGGQG